MVQISLQNITKSYGKTKALDDISFDIYDKEFLVLFGPAGAGKTTLLKVISGLIRPDEGDILFDTVSVKQTEPRKRNVSMVFENYALYPHLSVYENIASPLRSKLYKKSESEIENAVNNITKVMHINHLLERKPYALSNGQRQRVALGRSLVRDPNIFLLDEPLAHLDAKLRHLMRTELKEMQTQFDTTTLYVTHDYLEALSLGDRIAVVKDGQLVQIAQGEELYYRPKNLYVATLIGEPEINVFSMTKDAQNQFILFPFDRNINISCSQTEEKLLEYQNNEFLAAIRAHDIDHSSNKLSENSLKVEVQFLEPIGNKSVLIASYQGKEVRIAVDNNVTYPIGGQIYIDIPTEKMLFFDSKTEEFITRPENKEQKRRKL